jgi:1-acyl-sn-glycerol-3-phosphate acyltransferase
MTSQIPFGIIRTLNHKNCVVLMILENWPAWARNAVLALTGIAWGSRILRKAEKHSETPTQMIEYLLNRNNIRLSVRGKFQLPQRRGSLIVANHPHGFIDGLALMWLGQKDGLDTRAVTRHYTSVFEPIQNLFVYAKTDNERQTTNGEQVVEQASQFVIDGGSLAICASGRINEAKPFWQTPKEVSWKTGTVRIAQAAQAPIVLVHIDIDQPMVRQLVHAVNPVLRNLMQIWAYLLGRRHNVTLHLLEIIEPEDLLAGTVQQQTEWLRERYDAGVEALEAERFDSRAQAY